MAIRGLTTNVTDLYAYNCRVVASGGVIYFEADPKINNFPTSYVQ